MVSGEPTRKVISAGVIMGAHRTLAKSRGDLRGSACATCTHLREGEIVAVCGHDVVPRDTIPLYVLRCDFYEVMPSV